MSFLRTLRCVGIKSALHTKNETTFLFRERQSVKDWKQKKEVVRREFHKKFSGADMDAAIKEFQEKSK